MSIVPKLHSHDALSMQRPEKLRAGRSGSCQPPFCDPHFARYRQRAERSSMGKHGCQQAGQLLPHPRPTGWGTHCPWSSQHLFGSKRTSTQDPRGVGMRTQRSCCPAPGTEGSEGKRVSPPDRGCLCCTGLLLLSAMTLARSWDWGPADFTSCRFCSRICVEREGERSSGCSQAGGFGRGIPRAYGVQCPVVLGLNRSSSCVGA